MGDRVAALALGLFAALCGCSGAPAPAVVVADSGGGDAATGTDGGAPIDDAGGPLDAAAGEDAILPPYTVPVGLTLIAGKPGGTGFADGRSHEARLRAPTLLAMAPGGRAFFVDQGTIVRTLDVASGKVGTLVGGAKGTRLWNDGEASVAGFDSILGLAWGSDDNLYATDNGCVRRIDPVTGQVTTVAGDPHVRRTSDGVGRNAFFRVLSGLAGDAQGHLFITDAVDRVIRMIDIATAHVTTLAGDPGVTAVPGSGDGVGAEVLFQEPRAVASDGQGNLYVGDYARLRKVVSATRQVSTVTEVSSSWPSRGQVTLSFDPSGAGGLLVSVADSAEVLRLPLDSLQLTNVAGVRDASGTTDGSRDVARLGRPVAAVAFGQTLIIVDGRTGTIRRADLLSGAIDTIAGSVSNNGSENGIGDGARFDRPGKIAGDGGDNLFLLDDNNQKLRRISLRTGQVSTLSDLAVGPAAPTLSLEPVARPLGLAFIAPDRLYVSHSNGWLGRVDPGSGSLRILLGPADVPSQLTWDPTVLAPESDGKLLIGDGLWNRLYRYDEATGKATSVSYIYDGHQVIDPTAMVLDGRGTAYVADGGMDVVVRVDVASGQWMVLAGQRGTSGFVDGPGFDARFNNPHDLIFDGPDHLLVADTMNGAIRRVSITSGEVTTWIGAPGRQGVKVGALPAGLNQPRGLYALPDGGVVITDGAENVVLTAR